MIPHQGIVYNILVRDTVENSEAAYVPIFAYDCDINNVETCKSFGKLFAVSHAFLLYLEISYEISNMTHLWDLET